jgi:AraC family transcriptional regulator, ethanolamine operon transcriptional activator
MLDLVNPREVSDPPTGAGHLSHHSFGNIDELAAFFPDGRNLTITQLELQPFRSESKLLVFETIWVNFNRANGPIKVVGGSSFGFLSFVCLPHGTVHPVISHGRAITHDFIYGFDPNRGVNKVFPGHTTHCSINIRPDVFAACAQAMDRWDLNADFWASHFLYVPSSLPPLKVYLNQLYHLMEQRSPLVQRPTFEQVLLQDLLPLLIATLPIQNEQLKLPLKPYQRSSLVKQAEDYMQAHLDRPLTLADLCQALGTSSRALSYGFQDIFGMSPMAYLKILRLHGVHRALKASNSDSTMVLNIANQFGFWSAGHFARDYKTMFGELPSETLKQ